MESHVLGNEGLMVRLCKESIATEHWASETEDECVGCELGAVTAFFATGTIYNIFIKQTI